LQAPAALAFAKFKKASAGRYKGFRNLLFMDDLVSCMILLHFSI